MTYPKFEVGEMVVAQHATYFSEYDGSPGIVTQPLGIRRGMDLNLMEKVFAHVYGVRLLVRGEPSFWFRPWQLRKIGSKDYLELGEPDKASCRKAEGNLFPIRAEAV